MTTYEDPEFNKRYDRAIQQTDELIALKKAELGLKTHGTHGIDHDERSQVGRLSWIVSSGVVQGSRHFGARAGLGRDALESDAS